MEGFISKKRLKKYINEMYQAGIKISFSLENETRDLDEYEAFKLLDAYINHYKSCSVPMVYGELTWKF